MASIKQDAQLLRDVFEDGRNIGRHEAITDAFDAFAVALEHNDSIDGMRRWYEAARAIYEEHRPQ